MKLRMWLAPVLISAGFTSACQSTAGENEQVGVIVGGIVGGVLGNQVGKGSGRTAATIFGSVIGSQIGGSVGRSMDQADLVKTSHSLENIRTGVPTAWRNPDSGNQYTVTPTRTIESGAQPCREYTIDAVIGGRKEKVYGTACRQADGSWKTMAS